MPSITPSSIRNLKDRIDIYEVVSREVSLKRAGSSYKGLSPFTSEKTPSFFISPDKGLYKCFSTGQAGDIISFVMETERLSFVEAVEALAARFHVQLEYEQDGRPKEDRSLRQELFDLHDFIASYYREAFLAEDEEGKWIRRYLTQDRGFPLDVAEDFGIGYAPTEGVELGQRVLSKGYSKESLEACGLFYTRRGLQAETMGYRFRGRLAIPIRDHQGRVCAFTARQLELTPADDPSREAKYVNSPETPIFVKGNLLFNLDRARMEVSDDVPFVMVEGQLDAVRCASAGIKGVIAPQGTGVTEQQLRMLKRYEPQLLCVLDGDSAGQKAALRLLPLAFAQGVECSFIPLPTGIDPDDSIREGGLEAWNNLLSRRTEPIPFVCASLAPDPDSLSPQAKAKVSREIFRIIGQAESEAAQMEFARQLAAGLRLDEPAILADFQRFRKAGRQPGRNHETRSSAAAIEPKREKSVYSVEKDLLTLCVHRSDLGREIAEVVDESWIDQRHPAGKLLNHVLNDFIHDLWNGPDLLSETLESADERALLADVLFQSPEYEMPLRLANEAIRRILEKHANRKIAQIKLEIAREQTKQDADLLALFDEIVTLKKAAANPPQINATNAL